MIITKELRDLLLGVLGNVRSDNINFNMTIKGIITTLKELEDETLPVNTKVPEEVK